MPKHQTTNEDNQFRTLYEKMPLPYQSLDADGRFLAVNPAWTSTFGYSSSDIYGMNFKELLPPSQAGLFEENFAKFKEQGTISGLNYRIQHQDGHYVDVAADGIVGYYADGSFRQTYCVLRDVSKQKKAEEALRKSEKQKSIILDSTLELFAYYDTDFVIQWTNKASADSVGKTPEELVGSHCFSVWQGRNMPCEGCPLLTVLKEGRKAQNEIKTPDGRHWRLTGYPVFDKNGQIEGIVELGQDITAETTLKEKLNYQQKAFKTVLENIPYAVFVHDLDGKFLIVNRCAEQYTGYSRKELLNMTVEDLDHGSLTRTDRANIWHQLQLGGKKQFRSVHYRKNKSSYAVELSISAFSFQTKPIILAIAQDITARIEAEQAIKERESQLQEAVAAKDKFFSIIAHDLRNPFSALVNISELILMQSQEGEYDKMETFARVMNDTAQQGNNLLDNLLTWSRAQSGRINYKPIRIHLAELAKDVLSLASATAAQKNVGIELNIPRNIQVFADVDMLKTILRNLLTNAVKYSYNGSKVLLSASQKDYEVKITVADNGVGICPELQASLFKLGKQVSTRGTQDEAGTGLGLILCREFVDKHEGHIGVNSTKGKGAEFWFTLPAGSDPA